ncbi:hypothetical protein ACQKDY_02925 [Alteromonas macleodii]|uniref:hypothetical protein n=1 Tax=Alteromonas macleodii TaxID=28108 RepID=UPI003D0341BF
MNSRIAKCSGLRVLLLRASLVSICILSLTGCFNQGGLKKGFPVGQIAFFDYSYLPDREQKAIVENFHNKLTKDGKLLRIYVERATCNRPKNIEVGFTLNGKTNYYPIKHFYSDNKANFPVKITNNFPNSCTISSKREIRENDFLGFTHEIYQGQKGPTILSERKSFSQLYGHKEKKIEKGEFEKEAEFKKRMSAHLDHLEKEKNFTPPLFSGANFLKILPSRKKKSDFSLRYNADEEHWVWNPLNDNSGMMLWGNEFSFESYNSKIKSYIKDTAIQSFQCGNEKCDFSMTYPQAIQLAKEGHPEIYLGLIFSVDKVDTRERLIFSNCSNSQGCDWTLGIYRAHVGFAALFENDKVVQLLFESSQSEWLDTKHKILHYLEDVVDYQEKETRLLTFLNSVHSHLSTPTRLSQSE